MPIKLATNWKYYANNIEGYQKFSKRILNSPAANTEHKSDLNNGTTKFISSAY
jgi:hypothetical protein